MVLTRRDNASIKPVSETGCKCVSDCWWGVNLLQSFSDPIDSCPSPFYPSGMCASEKVFRILSVGTKRASVMGLVMPAFQD